MRDEGAWQALDDALNGNRPVDALRLAVALWRETRDAGLADLVDSLDAFVDSDPQGAPKEAPDDPAALGGWLLRVEEAGLRIFEGAWYTRNWTKDALALAARYGRVDDPRVATAIAEFLFDPRVLHAIGDGTPFVERLVALGDARTRPRLIEHANAVEGPSAATRRALRLAVANFPATPDPSEEQRAIVARGLARYRDAPQRYIDLLLEPERDPDDGTEQVASDALIELGHPYGEAIALENDRTAGVISAAGKERLAVLTRCHERRWIGRALYLATRKRVYRGGLLDEVILSRMPPEGAIIDARLARLRVLGTDAADWDIPEAKLLSESPWLGNLEELDVPTFEVLGAIARDAYPKLRRLRLRRLGPIRHTDDWNDWAQPLAAWLDHLPSLREVVFRLIPEDGLESLLELIVRERLHERIETFSLDGAHCLDSWIPRGTGDPTLWFRILDGHGIRRAALYYTDATFTVEWTPAGLVVTLETSEGGRAFELLGKVPPRPVARLVLRDFPSRRPKKLVRLGRLSREIGKLDPRAIEMPVRWKNQLAGLPE